MKKIVTIVIFLHCICLPGQTLERDWPKADSTEYNSCKESTWQSYADIDPDFSPTIINHSDFLRGVSESDEIKIMRQAGILSCNVEIKFIISEAGEIICYNLISNCHPYWDKAIVNSIPKLKFCPSFEYGNYITSKTALKFSWKFEW